MHPDSVQKPLQTRRAYFLRERFVAPDELASVEGVINLSGTAHVAAALTYGHQIPSDGYARVIDSREPDKTNVVFGVLEREDVVFEPFAGETIKTEVMMERIKDREWCEANRNHPIAIMHFALDAYQRLVKAIRQHKPLMIFQHGRNKAHVVIGGDEAENRFFLERAGFAPEEVAEILKSIQ